MENNNTTTATTHGANLFETMYASTVEKIERWESIGFSRTDAIEKAKSESCAGRKVWDRIEAETLRYMVKCDQCRKTVRFTDSIQESNEGEQCEECREANAKWLRKYQA